MLGDSFIKKAIDTTRCRSSTKVHGDPFLTSKEVPLGAQHGKVGTSQTVITSKTDVIPQIKELNPTRQSGIRVVLYQNILGRARIVPQK